MCDAHTYVSACVYMRVCVCVWCMCMRIYVRAYLVHPTLALFLTQLYIVVKRQFTHTHTYPRIQKYNYSMCPNNRNSVELQYCCPIDNPTLHVCCSKPRLLYK